MRFVAIVVALVLALWHGIAGLSEGWSGVWTLLIGMGTIYPVDEFWNAELNYIASYYGLILGPLHILAGLARLLPAVGLAAGAVWFAARDSRGLMVASALLLLLGTAGALLLHNAESLFFKSAYDFALIEYWGVMQGYELAYTLGSFRFFVVALVDLLLFGVSLVMTVLLVFAARPGDTDE